MKSFIQIAVGTILLMLFLFACSGGDVETNFNTENPGFVNWNKSPKIYAEGTFETELPFMNQKEIRLTAIRGDVFIDGYNDAESIMVESQLRVGSDSISDAEAQLANMKIQVVNQDDAILIRTIEPEKSGKREYSVDFHIMIPSSLKNDLTLVSGSITVQNIENSVNISSVNGDIFLWDIFGNVDINLVNGSIDSSVTLPDDGEISISTVNGNIDMSIPGSTSAIFYARETNGSISTSNLEYVTSEQTLRSLAGTIGDGNGMIELETVNGYISIVGFD